MGLTYLIRVRPGTPSFLEKQIAGQLRSVAPQWVPDIKQLEEGRAEIIWDRVRLYVLYILISGALLLLVALGLVGVLWQSVTQRTQEIGIRRAAGATRGQIYLQFAGEMLALTTVAVAAGAVLVVHSAALDLFPTVDLRVYAAGLLTAAAILYLLVTAAALQMQPEGSSAPRLPQPGSMSLVEMEKAMILSCLEQYAGNVSKVAEALGLSRAALYRRCEKHGITL